MIDVKFFWPTQSQVFIIISIWWLFKSVWNCLNDQLSEILQLQSEFNIDNMTCDSLIRVLQKDPRKSPWIFFYYRKPTRNPYSFKKLRLFYYEYYPGSLEGASWSLAGVFLITLMFSVCKISRISHLFVMLEYNKTLKSYK